MESHLVKFRVVFYAATIVFALLVNARIDPKAAADLSEQMTSAEAGVAQLN